MPEATPAKPIWTPNATRYRTPERAGEPDGTGRGFFERTGRDPREHPIRLCPIHEREIHSRECATICGKQYLEECKFADRDPKPDEMMTARPLMVAEEGEAWVKNWRKQHTESLRKGQLRR